MTLPNFWVTLTVWAKMHLKFFPFFFFFFLSHQQSILASKWWYEEYNFNEAGVCGMSEWYVAQTKARIYPK